MEFGDWIKHDSGECPIPNMEAGDFQVKLRSGNIKGNDTHVGWPARDFAWEHSGEKSLAGFDIIEYRTLKKQSELDRLEGYINTDLVYWNAQDQSQLYNQAFCRALNDVLRQIKLIREEI